MKEKQITQEGSYNARKYRNTLLRYKAVLNQSGTDIPTARVLESSFDVVYTREDVGAYTLTIPNKTLLPGEVLVTLGLGEGSSDFSYGAQVTNGAIDINCADILSAVDSDDALVNIPITIELL